MSLIFRINSTDITNYVLDVTGLEFRRDVTNKIIIPHPTFTLDENCTVDVDDIIDMYVDGTIKFRCYVSKIKLIGDNKKEVQAWDLLKKLDNYYVALMNWNEWSGSYSHSVAEANYNPGSTDWPEQYISVLFFLRVLIWKAISYSFSSIDVTDISGNDSGYETLVDYSNVTLNYENLLLQWEQMKDFGKAVATDGWWESLTLLEAFQEIMSIFNFKYRYDGVKIYLELYDSYTLPGNSIIYYRSKENVKEYDDLSLAGKNVDDLSKYYSADYGSSDIDSFTVYYPDSVSEPKITKKINLSSHVEVHWFDSSVNELKKIQNFDGEHFYDQYAVKLYNRLDNNYKYKLETEMTLNKDVHSNALNFSNNRSAIEYIR